MPEVIGRIENMEEKQAANGGTYTVVDIKGEDQGYFDWDGCVVAAEAKVGDTVRIEHSGGKYPRIKGVEKLDQGKGGKEETNNNSARTAKDMQIARMCALKAAACLLQNCTLTHEELASEVVVLSERLERWVLR